MTDKPWPGTTPDGACPECSVVRDGWDMEYHVARIDRFGVTPMPEKLVGMRCPTCKTKFKVSDHE